ncbi:hypothetical protein A8924_5396 [Saccharopolyspora erythraea NRRL 2338]|nr:protealysin inhibitor emfourin [Saccharopolyspora erythraea]EQD86081.1 hypothetical protein N599_11490 [Saccharopolyspora erythraea D]PFG97922.1 hypothetical protein A8924_5396 [Saccharopolyspora erythraea NRRL 2338]
MALQRTGGLFAGAELTTSVRSADLDDESREALERHIEQAGFEQLAQRSPITGPGADMYQYEVTLERGGRRSSVVVSQTAVPDSLRPLVEWLEQRAIDEQ